MKLTEKLISDLKSSECVRFADLGKRPLNNTICYLNTDLDLTSGTKLSNLAKAFEVGGARLCM